MRCWLTPLLISLVAIFGCNQQPQGNSVADVKPSNTSSDDVPFANLQPNNDNFSAEQSVDEIVNLIVSTIGESESVAPAAAFAPPLSANDVNAVLQQCIHHILNTRPNVCQRPNSRLQ